jgi:ABC-type Fe3+/spermidine/putrescine transport system ATPase subunit
MLSGVLDMSHLRVHQISKSYGGAFVLRRVGFDVAEGEVACLLGPSGCGKTTLLRIIAGLEAPDEGSVLFAGRDLAAVPVHRRGFGLMFQDFVLFPHKDVEANIAFGLRMQGRSAPEIEARVSEMLELVSLQGYERRQVYELSGGEQQRVALARSLAPEPVLLMLDEPLGSLDRTLREDLMGELRAILKGVGVTTLYVTHDQEEAFAVADHVLIMQSGSIVQEGTPEAVYRQPASEFVARFLGLHNLLPGRVAQVAGDLHAGLQIDTALGRLGLDRSQAVGVQVGDDVTVVIRPEAGRLVPAPSGRAGANLICGVLRGRSFRGSAFRLLTRHSGDIDLEFEVAGAADLPQLDDTVWLSLDSEAMMLLPRV